MAWAVGGRTTSWTRRRVVALTGSADKTSTKDLLAQVLQTMEATVATPLSPRRRVNSSRPCPSTAWRC